MARKKTHIRNPRRRSASLCGRGSVDFVEKNSEADCGTCRRMATDGTLEKLEFEHSAAKAPGYNNSGTPRLTERQRKFAANPVVTTDPQKAARDAGYSDAYAKAHSYALREQLAPLIMQLQEQAKRINAISVARVQVELATMGFANIIDYFDINEVTGAMRPKQLNELSREQAAAIQEVKVIDVVDEDTGVTHYLIGSIKLADKRANLVELGKTLGMFNRITIEDKRESAVLMADVDTESLEEAERILLSAVAVAKNKRKNKEAIPGECERLPDRTGEPNE